MPHVCLRRHVQVGSLPETYTLLVEAGRPLVHRTRDLPVNSWLRVEKDYQFVHVNRSQYSKWTYGILLCSLGLPATRGRGMVEGVAGGTRLGGR